MIARIRKGNDFHVAWQIKRGGVAENLENVTDIKLERTIYGITTEHTLFTVSGDTITAEIPAEVQTHYGQYKLTLSYELVDTGMSDDDRKCKVAIYAFAIVDPLGPADDLLTVDVASDVSIGFKGDKGLSAYQVWLEQGNVGTEDDYFAYLRQPATDAAESIGELEQTIEGNESLRVTAEQGRSDAEDLRDQAEVAREEAEGIREANETDRIEAEGIRDANEGDRINAERDRADAEELREQAEVAREEAEGLRQTNTNTAIQNAVNATAAANTAAGLANNAATAANTAAGDANNAAEAANTAAGLANTARTELTTAVNTKLDEADAKIEEMDETLSTYDGRVSQVEYDIDQLAGDVSLLRDDATVKMENLVVNGDFRNGTTGWLSAANAENIRIDGGMIAYDSLGGWNGIMTPISIQTTSGDKCYIRTSVIVNQDVGIISDQIGFYRPNVVSYSYGALVANTMKSMSAIIISSFTGLNSIRLRTGAASGTVVKWGKTSLINLTKIFGAGNEPTKEEFELLLSILGDEYFEGEITIPAQKVMQWQLKLIRKNKNAIIALGGTII